MSTKGTGKRTKGTGKRTKNTKQRLPAAARVALLLPLMLLVFIGSGFVPTDTLPGPVRVFAEYQPFTPIIETIRGLLTGTAIGNDAIVTLAWCLAIGVVGYRWAMAVYERDPARRVRVLSAGGA